MKENNNISIQLVVVLLFLFPFFIQGQETYEDKFNNVSYNNNDGTQNWSTNWLETGDDNDPSSGYVEVNGGRLEFHQLWPITERISRTANLLGATSVTLSFDVETTLLDGSENLQIQISTNGTSFTTLDSFYRTDSGSYTYNITSYASETTVIRFKAGGINTWESSDYAYIDNVKITFTPPIYPINTPLTLFDEFSGYVDYAVAGGSFRTDSSCSITTTSTGDLTSTIPNTATIEKAYLLWSHSATTPDETITFDGQTVAATITNQAYSSLNSGLNFFGMVSDVTTIVQNTSNINSHTFTVTNLTIDNTNTNNNYCSSTVVLGGWSLMVFYSDPSLPASTINFYNGFDPEQDDTQSFTLGGFYAIGSTGAKTTVLSWEGDTTLANRELLSVTTSSGTYELSGDGDNVGIINNPFNSTIFDNTDPLNIVDYTAQGVDLDTYDVSSYISAGDNSITTNVGVGQDLVILNSVLLKVPSNLIKGTVFEDVNYPTGLGRDLATASGKGVENAIVELYDKDDKLIRTTTTDTNGEYIFAGMTDDSFKVRVVNSSVKSTRSGGATCTTCIPVQTYKNEYTTSGVSGTPGTKTENKNQIGGNNPLNIDASSEAIGGSLPANAQTVSNVSIYREGIVGIDFGFNFNTIVNTNENGQGSLEQFIINSNNLGETSLDIEPNSIFDPALQTDVAIFMIPPTGDALGRTADPNFSGGVFTININATNLSEISDDNTQIDSRTQTAYSGDTNAGNITVSTTNVGTSNTVLPTYNFPEIAINSTITNRVFQISSNNVLISNLAIYGNSNFGIVNAGGTNTLPVVISNNLIGTNAIGNTTTGATLKNAIEINDNTSVTEITANYLASNEDSGINVNNSGALTITSNIFETIGNNACSDAIFINDGNNILIEENLINNTASIGIDTNSAYTGGVSINDNTIIHSGQNGGQCAGNIEASGIRLYGSNSSITSNIIANNLGAGVVLTGGNTSGNLISKNSIYNNGTTTNPALGIDIDNSGIIGDGVTLNDLNDADNGPNGSPNFPVLETATIFGNKLKVTGWSRPNAILEFFITDISEGTASSGDNSFSYANDYGEGQTYLASATEGSALDSDTTTSTYNDVDGNTDNTNRFNITITLPSRITNGTLITATATVLGTTSEFSNAFVVKVPTIITNRRITYRVKPN